jgi:hypothetical protein
MVSCKAESPSLSDTVYLQCADRVYIGNGKRQWMRKRNAIGHTHGSASRGAQA